VLALDFLNTDAPVADSLVFTGVLVAAVVDLAGAVVLNLIPDTMMVLAKVGAVVGKRALLVAPVGVGVAVGVAVIFIDVVVTGGRGRGAEDGWEDEGEESKGLHCEW